ncbi:metal-dependent hydrolase [Legionella jamestowniensis]|uniref:Integral membrane protein n=1 Tax=Legionella jamestowniensis TaxID=455 RepID=A0A0W0UKP8_9GAMM|nr:metal-dependent hydrolase [Legionella jamestowniensis]KTD08478.1 integral membrane protein [Legionella jamestowniensis]SFL51652.1 inner membrane protein [Legionella jamestowniensis DSM 19215]
MDPVTQGALGAACAQAILHKRDRHNAWIVGGLAGMAADLDIFINSSSDPLLFFIYHRQFTHSLLFVPLGALLVSLVLMLFRRFRNHFVLTFLAAFIGYGTHGLLDALTSYGTVLYWPFSNTRVSWDLISIIDPFFTFPLILGLTWTIVNNNVKGVFYGLAVAMMIVLFNAYQHYRGLQLMQHLLKREHLMLHRLRLFPKMASSTYWRGIAISKERLFVFDITLPVLGNSNAIIAADYPLARTANLPAYVKNSPSLMRDFTVFNWFCDGYVIMANPLPLLVADGRFLMDDNPAVSLWGILFYANQPHVKRLNFIELETSK